MNDEKSQEEIEYKKYVHIQNKWLFLTNACNKHG